MVLLIDSWLIPNLHMKLWPSLLLLLVVISIDIKMDGVFRNFRLSEIKVGQDVSWNL